MSEETTTEQLAEIEGQAADTPATEYTPPYGWRVLAVGELVMLDDQWVRQDGSVWRSMGTEGPVSEGARYIRRIKPEPVQVREGRWRTRGGKIRNVTPTPEDDERAIQYPWYDARHGKTWLSNGQYYSDRESQRDLVKYLGLIEPQPQPQPEPEPEKLPEGCQNDGGWSNGVNGTEPEPWPVPQPEPESDAELRIRLLKQANDSQAETIGRLLTEARDLNMEIGGLERRLSERDARIQDLETIYSAAMKSFEDANKANDALRAQVRILQREADKKVNRIEFLETLNAGNGAAIDEYKAKVEKLQGLVDSARGQLETAATEHDSLSTQLAAVKAELVTQAETSRRLQIELDAAQQVPAGSPELRQLRLDLAEVTLDRDQYKDAYTRLTAFVETIRETTKAEAVEAIVEWLVPIRTCGSQALATAVISNLPHIMRSLTGLEDEGIE